MTVDRNPLLKSLVERFRNNRQDYKSGGYNETQTRREFIDPLLEILDWDVSNKQNFAEAYKHVVHEDHIKVGGSSKAPDYSFRVGSVRKFFLEAKKPSVNILTDPEPAYQIRRYAWSAKLPLSVLTNFETFAVYDCRTKPHKSDGAAVARLFTVDFEDYLTRWNEIEQIFSLDAINRGAFDRFADEKRSSRGTVTIDDDFLDEIERWRDLLAKAFMKNNKLDSYQLNDVVQKTIDRIVFLRIAEDRGIEPEGYLKKIAERNGVYRELCKYFRQADERYNSGLFHFRRGDGNDRTVDSFTLNLVVEDRPLKSIIENLYQPKSPYAFAVIPADILGQVYERFLGRVIRVRGRSIVIDEKPDVKKAGGVFYTPTFVVRYIVHATLDEALVDKSVEQAASNKNRILRIVDPSCGSGSFLIEAYQYLLDWYLTQYIRKNADKYSSGRHAKIYRGPGNTWRLTVSERRRILTTHIFGVDIDPQAVEVTKLSLLLKVLEGESKDVIAAQMHLFNQRALPDLAANIKCGNSLIDEEFYGLFEPSQFSDEERHKINVFNWRSEFPTVFQDGGFSAVIGNPPYGALLLEEEKEFLTKRYPSQSYQLDTYLLFLERTIETLAQKGGQIGFIIPNPWLTNLLQTKMRNLVLSHTQLREIVHFTFQVFSRARATVDTEIVILRNEFVKRNRFIAKVVNRLPPSELISSGTFVKIMHEQDELVNKADMPINIFLGEKERKLAEKIQKSGKPLGFTYSISVGMKPYQVGKGKPKQNRSDVEKRIFDSEIKISDEYRQYLRGGDINRFVISPLEKRFIRYGEWLAEPRPSARFDTSPKIVMRQTGDSLVAAIDTKKFICMNNMHVLVPNESNDDVYYCLGLLNSRLMNWYYQSLNPEMGEALAEVKKTNVERLPAPPKSIITMQIGKISADIETTVEELRAAKAEVQKTNAKRRLDGLFDRLNAKVYELFDLTSGDIEIIEKSQRKIELN